MYKIGGHQICCNQNPMEFELFQYLTFCQMISFASAPTSLNHIKMHYITDHGAIINVSYSFIWPFAFAEKAGLRLGFLYRLRCWANSVLLHEFAPKGLAMPFYHDRRIGVKRWGYCQQLVLTSCTGTFWIKGCNAELRYLGSFSFTLENHPTYCMYRCGWCMAFLMLQQLRFLMLQGI